MPAASVNAPPNPTIVWNVSLNSSVKWTPRSNIKYKIVLENQLRTKKETDKLYVLIIYWNILPFKGVACPNEPVVLANRNPFLLVVYCTYCPGGTLIPPLSIVSQYVALQTHTIFPGPKCRGMHGKSEAAKRVIKFISICNLLWSSIFKHIYYSIYFSNCTSMNIEEHPNQCSS